MLKRMLIAPVGFCWEISLQSSIVISALLQILCPPGQ